MIGSTLGSYRILDKLGASHGDLDEFDVARDVRFLIVKAAATSREIPQVIVNWFEILKQTRNP